MFFIYFFLFFIVIFFNTAIIACANIRLNGGDPTVSDGLRIASQNIGRILIWALISATIGMILQAIRQRGGWVGKLIAGVFGIAWTYVTFFIIPVLIYEKKGIASSIRRSASLFKQTWGETHHWDIWVWYCLCPTCASWGPPDHSWLFPWWYNWFDHWFHYRVFLLGIYWGRRISNQWDLCRSTVPICNEKATAFRIRCFAYSTNSSRILRKGISTIYLTFYIPCSSHHSGFVLTRWEYVSHRSPVEHPFLNSLEINMMKNNEVGCFAS